MRNRTKSRECALQMLYQVDIRRAEAEQTIAAFWDDDGQAVDDIRTYADQLVRGTLEHLPEIDQLIGIHAANWDLKRMAVIDRNILRLGTYELLYLRDVPAKVCINEAIELAKRFGAAESGKFINGILDAIHKKGRGNGEHR
jgi:N utilization substance protein B